MPHYKIYLLNYIMKLLKLVELVNMEKYHLDVEI